MRWTLLVAVLVLTLVPACAEASACDEAFAQAAEASDFEDSVSDLYPAVRACDSVEEWVEASEAHPDALDGADPRTFLRNICQGDAVADAELCAQVSDGD